jgi:two-component system sensor histidine kinase UhpB
MVSAKKNVRDEVLSTQSLAIFAIENGIKKNPEIYLFQEEGEPFGFSKLLNLRHLKIEYYDENRYLRDQTLTNQDYSESPPSWFVKSMEIFSTQIPEQIIDINLRGKEFGYILIKPEPLYEYSEIWAQYKKGLWIILIFFSLINLLIFVVFYLTLQPINNLIHGFQKLEDENYNVRIKKNKNS